MSKPNYISKQHSYHHGGIKDLPIVHLQVSQYLQVAQAHLDCCEHMLHFAREEILFRNMT